MLQRVTPQSPIVTGSKKRRQKDFRHNFMALSSYYKGLGLPEGSKHVHPNEARQQHSATLSSNTVSALRQGI